MPLMSAAKRKTHARSSHGDSSRPAPPARNLTPGPYPHTLSRHTQLIILAGSTVGGKALRRGVLAAQREQADLCAAADLDRGAGPSSRRRVAGPPKVAVDAVFFGRLRGILKM